MASTTKDGVGQKIAGGVARTLLREAQHYAEARGEDAIRNLGQKVVGAIDGSGAGGDGGGGGVAATALASGVKGVAQRAFGGGGGGRRGRGGGKSTNIIEDIDVGVPVSVAYNQWTQYQDFAGFMKGVEGVDQDDQDPTKSNWRLKIGLSRRSWQAATGEQIPDRRIAWTSQGAKGSTKGVITFHPLADDLTKIIVAMEYTAVGPVEKVGNMMRLQLRRVRLDLREFKRFITMQGEETGEWRGEIRDGEVVSEGEPGQEGQEEGQDRESPDQERDEEPEAREEAAAGGGRSR